MGFKPPGWDKEANPLPSPLEAALGLYLENREVQKHSHKVAVAKTIQQLPELTALQARLLLESVLPAVDGSGSR